MEHPLIPKRNGKIRLDFSVFNIAFNRFGLNIDHADKLNLRNHIFDAVLPVEQVNDFIVIHINRNIQPCFGLLAFEKHILIQFPFIFRCQNIGHRLIFGNVQHTMQTIRHIEHIGVVYEVDDKQVILARTTARTTTKLLHIDSFGHRWPCHKQNGGMRTVPAFVQQIAGAQYVR